MTNTLLVLELCHTLFYNYYVTCDIDVVMSCFSDACSWVGPGNAELFREKEAIRAYFSDTIYLLPPCVLDKEQYEVASACDDEYIVIGSYHLLSKDKQELLLKRRCTLLFKCFAGEWKISHLHTSDVVDGSTPSPYTRDMGEHTLDYMQRMLHEKTEIIDMIDNNAKCGLKGSNDDDTFSYYYVNEGLCRMLGYTYEEFMKMSQGHAVGTVYPPDLKKALDDVARCFSQGMEYSTEYRVRKKDGSLMWVLDSGRKHENKSGKMQINSILMDINDLKRSQINLQLEQERYRIALENITDVMFEYDIQKDHLIKYVRKDYSRTNPVEKVYIDHYFQTMERGNYIHLDDVGTLKAFLLDTISEKIIHIRLYESEDNWKWIEVHGSYMYEDETPVKCIGIWKDITKEKLEHEHLIDLTQRDALTTLYHQKSVEKPIQDIMNQEESAMMIMDIDDFKGFNDTFGHLKGNDILVAVRDVLLSNSEGAEFVCRIGGDEFMIFFPASLREKALSCAEQIIRKAATVKIKDIQVTLSIGIAYGAKAESFQELFRKADEAMYYAKNNGRNQTVVWDPTKQIQGERYE